jgi:hypothetical protein
MGQFSAPGTAAAVTGAAVTGVAAVTGGAAVTGVAAMTGVAVTGTAVRGAAVALVVDAAPHPGADAATTAPATIQRPT